MARDVRRIRRPPPAGGPGLTSLAEGRPEGADLEGADLESRDAGVDGVAGSDGAARRSPGDARDDSRDSGGVTRAGTVVQGGRLKAYRPLPAGDRADALARALAAYRAGDYFEAHELLEPAWMGTADELERELYQGLIKLAAAGVHMVRGNPRGMTNNLEGARRRLARVVEGAGPDAGLDLGRLLGEIDEALAELRGVSLPPPRIPGSARFVFRPRVGVAPPSL